MEPMANTMYMNAISILTPVDLLPTVLIIDIRVKLSLRKILFLGCPEFYFLEDS